ncbi:bifunctional RNase H/acid phosphatase, partial [Streptomyces sp. NPDC058221]|uniref:bifunctional RNase H/acid phosphatase n=1 Tax=Streptomyces sp. NPDC058221 TaxID=3346388 RepID=UPI0036E0B90B
MTPPHQFVIEADGGSRGNPGPAGYGAVVIDPVTGQALAEAAEYIGVATNNVAEYKGLIAGLRAAKALVPDASDDGGVRVHVRMDSKLVVEQMSGRWKIKHPDMKPLAAEAARILPASAVTYEWIPREKNKHADRLANEAMDAGRRGKQWEPSSSTAALDTPGSTVAGVLPPVSGPPGDATAGAARARAALNRPAGETPQATTATPQVGWGTAADLGAPATFVLLRHGETALTPQKRFSGSGGTDPELSATGRRQAEHAAEAFAARGTVQEIVSSPLLRCRE